MHRQLFAVLLLVCAPLTSSAQVGKNTTLWNWTDVSPHHSAIVKVSLGKAVGTGIIVDVDREKPTGDGYEGYCLTAYHVVQNDAGRAAIKVGYRTGRVATKCRVVAFDKEFDTALVWVWVPSSIQPAKIADQPVSRGDTLVFSGLGGGSPLKCCLRSFRGKAAPPTNENVIYANISLLPGDSGGPVFNQTNEVVGVISGGWLWFDGGVRNGKGNPIVATWPARASNANTVRELMRQVEPNKVVAHVEAIASDGGN